MNDGGWISIHRKIKDHWLWSDPVKLKWWIDILLTVNHSESKVNIGNVLIECKRGQSIRSLQTWAVQWQTNKSMVRRFFDLLQNDEMISTENVKKSTRLTVCNYDSYQDSRNANETQAKRKRNANETQTTPNNNDNNVYNENKENNLDSLVPEGFQERWEKFNGWVTNQDFKYVSKIEEQLTASQLKTLIEKSNATTVMDKLLALENGGRKYIKNKSVYLTINSWINRDLQNG